MSDFCKECSILIFGEDSGDLSDLCKDGEMIAALCEGCGEVIYVDHNGMRIKADE